MLTHTRTLIGILVIGTAAMTAQVARAQQPAPTDGWVVLALDDYGR